MVQQDLMVEKMQAVVQDLESSISDITYALPSQWDSTSTDKEDTSMRPPSPVPSSPKLDSNAETSYKARLNPATPDPLCVHEDLTDEQPPPLMYGSDSDSDYESDMDTSYQRGKSDADFFLTGREDFETFVEKVTQSRTLTVLWNRHATRQGWSSWDDLDKGNLSAILQQIWEVQKAYLPECAPTHPRLTQHNLRFTSRWEEFFNDFRRVTLSFWSNPWSSPTAEYWHPDDTGGLGIDNQAPLLQVLNSVTAGSACFINTADCPDVSDEVFRIVNRKMQSFEDFRLVCVTKRDASSRWNSFLQSWEQKGRAALCGAVRFMNFRTYGVHKETWSRLN